ncbi:Heterogeneous nuclear ribonucleoprotein 27C, partial [Bienertia sinuspersici]
AATWSSVVKGSDLTKKGGALRFIPPVLKEGKKVAQLQKSELEAWVEKWATIVILYVVGETLHLLRLRRFFANTWNQVSTFTVFHHDKGFFVVKFASMEDQNSILYFGPHTLFGKPIIVKPWTFNFNFKEEVLKVIPLWVTLSNPPLHCWT